MRISLEARVLYARTQCCSWSLKGESKILSLFAAALMYPQPFSSTVAMSSVGFSWILTLELEFASPVLVNTNIAHYFDEDDDETYVSIYIAIMNLPVRWLTTNRSITLEGLLSIPRSLPGRSCFGSSPGGIIKSGLLI